MTTEPPGTTDWTALGVRLVRDPTPVPTSLAFSPDGRLLAAGTRTGRVLLWDLREQRVLHAWDRRDGERERLVQRGEAILVEANAIDAMTIPAAIHFKLSVHSVAFSPTGVIVCTGSGSGDVDFWTRAGRLIRSSSSEQGAIRHVSYHDDGQIVAHVANNGLTARNVFADLPAWSILLPEKLSLSDLIAVAPDGRSLAVESDGSATVARYDRAAVRLSWREGLYLSGGPAARDAYSSDIHALQWDASGTRLAMLNRDGFVQLWQCHDDEPLFLDIGCATASIEDARVEALLSGHGDVLALASRPAAPLALWSSSADRTVVLDSTDDVSGASVSAATLDPVESYLAVGFSNGAIGLWDFAGSRIVQLRPD